MHPKVKKAFEEIDAMMLNSDGPQTDYEEIEPYILRWKKKIDEVVEEATQGTHDELIAAKGIGPIGTNLTRISGDTDGPRRREEPMDYNRAQPTKEDVSLVEAFIIREFAPEDVDRYQKSAVARKMGLLVAMQFNRGFDSGVESVRDENGWTEGYNACLKMVKRQINSYQKRGKGD